MGMRSFEEVFVLQKELRARRILGEIPDTLLTVEHPKVITRGRRKVEEDFLVPPEKLRERGFSIADAGRGGRLTYHGPGQLVGYFIFSLRERRLGIPQFVRKVEETMIQTLAEFSIASHRREGCPGVWIQNKKIASIGLAIDRGVSMHGVALNVDPNLEDFSVIYPCGMPHCEMTSMKRELKKAVAFSKVEWVFQRKVQEIF